MEVLHTHCAGLDVHTDTVVACFGRVIADIVGKLLGLGYDVELKSIAT